MGSILSVGITATKSLINYLTSKTKNRWCYFQAHFQNRTVSMSLPVLSMKAAYLSFMNVCNQSPCWLTMMQGQTLLTLHWCSFSECGRERVAFSFGFICGLYHIYECLYPISTQITQDARPKIVDTPLTLISRVEQWACLSCFRL